MTKSTNACTALYWLRVATHLATFFVHLGNNVLLPGSQVPSADA